MDMSDLSRLLGDVYNPEANGDGVDGDGDGGDDSRGAGAFDATSSLASSATSALPDWADEDVLDQAFSNWVPGPPSDAPAAERSMLSDLATGPQAARYVAGAEVPESAAAVPVTVPDPAPELTHTEDMDPEPAVIWDSGLIDVTVPADPAATAAAAATSNDAESEAERWKSWQRADDDILPRRLRRSRLRR